MNKLKLFTTCALFLLFSFPLEAKQKSFQRQFKELTRSDEVYKGEDFHASITWHATWLNESFLEAWAFEHARLYNLEETDRMAFLNDLKQKYLKESVFFISFYSFDKSESDLSQKDSVWKLTLDESQNKLSPTKIVPLGKPNSYDKHIFKSLDMWSKGFFVYFNTNLSQPFSISVHGPKGQGKLKWKTR